MLAGKPVVSVPVLKTGPVHQLKEITGLVRHSLYKTPTWRERLVASASEAGSDPDFVLRRETDETDLSEGLYIKWEEDGVVKGRYKWVRRGLHYPHFRFRYTLARPSSHQDGLAEGVDLFSLP